MLCIEAERTEDFKCKQPFIPLLAVNWTQNHKSHRRSALSELRSAQCQQAKATGNHVAYAKVIEVAIGMNWISKKLSFLYTWSDFYHRCVIRKLRMRRLRNALSTTFIVRLNIQIMCFKRCEFSLSTSSSTWQLINMCDMSLKSPEQDLSSDVCLVALQVKQEALNSIKRLRIFLCNSLINALYCILPYKLYWKPINILINLYPSL